MDLCFRNYLSFTPSPSLIIQFLFWLPLDHNKILSFHHCRGFQGLRLRLEIVWIEIPYSLFSWNEYLIIRNLGLIYIATFGSKTPVLARIRIGSMRRIGGSRLGHQVWRFEGWASLDHSETKNIVCLHLFFGVNKKAWHGPESSSLMSSHKTLSVR